MGAVPPSTIEEKIVGAIQAHSNREVVFQAVGAYRATVRNAVEASLWGCPIHEDIYNDDRSCLECQDAKEVNVIVQKILELSCLNESPYSS